MHVVYSLAGLEIAQLDGIEKPMITVRLQHLNLNINCDATGCLDTGFNGDLLMSQDKAEELGLKSQGIKYARMYDKHK
jgi:predicted aspartyl protease